MEKQCFRVVLLKPPNQLTSPFIVPQGHFFQYEFAIAIDQDRRMHLAAGGDSGDASNGVRHLLDDTPNTKNDSLPPDPRTLLRPLKTRNVLLILFRGERRDLSRLSYKRGSGASGSDVDRKQEIFGHEVHRGSLRKKQLPMANPISSFLRRARGQVRK
jgi:hypothetical protein